jgi:hypothetical protein
MRKGDRSDGDAVLGSTAIFANVDTNLIMRRKDDNTRIISSEQRYGENLPELALNLDPATDRVSSRGEYASIQVQDLATEILTTIADSEMTEPEIKEALGGNHTVTAKALRSMVENRILERRGKGIKNAPFTYRKADSRLRDIQNREKSKTRHRTKKT